MRKVVKLIIEMVDYANKRTKLCFVVWLISCILALNPLLNAALFAAIIDKFRDETLFAHFIYLILLYLLYKVVSGLLNSMLQFVTIKMQHKIDISVRNEIINSLDATSPESFEDNDWYEKRLVRVTRIVSCISDEISALSGLLSIVISVISYCLYLCNYNAFMIILGIAAALVSILKSIITHKDLYNQSVRASYLSAKYDRLYGDYFQINASLEMRTFSALSFMESIRQKRLSDIFQHSKETKIKNRAVDGCVLLMRFILCFILIYYLLFHMHASYGVAVAMIPYTLAIMSQLEGVSMTFLSIYFSAKEWDEIKSFSDSSHIGNRNSMNSCLKDSVITINNVCFSYPNGNQVLNNISLDIKKGETVAFVGENGCGKSTLLKILANIYVPNSGSVVNNRQYLKVENENDKQEIGFIFQEVVHYPLSFCDNIDPTSCDIERIRSLADKVGLDVTKYDDPMKILYPGFFESINISGGEWQKLAIIRLFYYYEKAEVYIFDEPTSALDPISEVEVFNLFKELAKEKTLIYATHRLGIAKDAQHIYVMKDGAIIDSGNHEALMVRCDLYRRMYKSQAEWYKRGGT